MDKFREEMRVSLTSQDKEMKMGEAYHQKQTEVRVDVRDKMGEEEQSRIDIDFELVHSQLNAAKKY